MLGRPLVAELVRRGHDVRVLTRTPPQPQQAGKRHHVVDVAAGAGLREALDGADAVIDATNTPGRGRTAWPVVVDGARRLLAAEAQAGVGHHVAISIVGIDSVPFSYYRAKLAQEELVEQGPVPWSIVRATQFHELLDLVFTTTARAGIVPASAFPVAPVDPRFVARVLADAAEAGPGGRLAAVAGPDTERVGEFARAWARERGRHVVALPMPLPRAARRALMAAALVPDRDRAVTGGPSFGEWMRHADRDRARTALAA